MAQPKLLKFTKSVSCSLYDDVADVKLRKVPKYLDAANKAAVEAARVPFDEDDDAEDDSGLEPGDIVYTRVRQYLTMVATSDVVVEYMLPGMEAEDTFKLTCPANVTTLGVVMRYYDSDKSCFVGKPLQPITPASTDDAKTVLEYRPPVVDDNAAIEVTYPAGMTNVDIFESLVKYHNQFEDGCWCDNCFFEGLRYNAEKNMWTMTLGS